MLDSSMAPLMANKKLQETSRRWGTLRGGPMPVSHAGLLLLRGLVPVGFQLLTLSISLSNSLKMSLQLKCNATIVLLLLWFQTMFPLP
jgi:hypothetical protein